MPKGRPLKSYGKHCSIEKKNLVMDFVMKFQNVILLGFIGVKKLVRVPSIALFNLQRNPIKRGVPLFFVCLKFCRQL